MAATANQVQKYLNGISYPANKSDIVRHARTKGADNTIIDALNKLPDQAYSSIGDVTKAMGEMEE